MKATREHINRLRKEDVMPLHYPSDKVEGDVEVVEEVKKGRGRPKK